jgi:hypothetical protein
MPIPASERQKMLAVRLCGPRVIARLESIGITELRDLVRRDPYQLVHEVNLAAGRPIWHPPIAAQAMANLIAAARESTTKQHTKRVPRR